MSSQIIKRPLPYLALLLAHSIWGANFVVAKFTLEEFPPMSLAFLRFGLACLFLAPFVWVQIKKIKVDKKDLPKLATAALFMITLNIAFFFEGIERTSAISASALSLVIPSFSVLLGWVYLKEKVSLVNLGGVLLGLVGALIIIGLPQIISGSFSTQTVIGNILIIISSIFFVIGAVFAHKMLKKYSTLTVTAIAFLLGAISFFAPAVREYLQDPMWTKSVTFVGVFGVIYMTLLSSISAYFLFEWGLSKLGVVVADLFQYIEPFIAAALAISLLGEKLSTSFIVGTALILTGMFLGTFGKEIYHRRHKAHRI